MWAVLQGNDSRGISKSQVPITTRSSLGPINPRDVGRGKREETRTTEKRIIKKGNRIKNEFRRIQRDEKEKQEGQQPKDRMKKTMGEEILEIIEKREKNGE